MGYLFLTLAIAGEIIGTNLLKASDGFTSLVPAVASLISYGLCFYFMALTLKTVNLNVTYAIWSGVGIVITTLIAVFYWKEPVNFASILGIRLILIGVAILDLYGPSSH